MVEPRMVADAPSTDCSIAGKQGVQQTAHFSRSLGIHAFRWL